MPAPDRRRGSTWTPEADEARAQAAQKARRRRTGGAQLAVVPAAGGPAADQVLVLRTRGGRFPGKRVSMHADGTLEVVPHDGASWYAPLGIGVSDVATLHAAFVRVAEAVDGAGIVVRGQLHADADPRAVTRRKTARRAGGGKRAAPAGLADAARWWLVLDLDKIPNALKLDPRVDPAATLAWLRGLLPAELAGAGSSWQWSSSSCLVGADGRTLAEGVAPATLSAHLRVWLSRPLTEAEASALLKRLRAAVAAELVRRGHEAPPLPVDPATATYNQPIYTVRPMLEGVADPFPGELRYGLTDGTPAVDVDALLASLPVSVATPSRALTPEQREARSAERRAARAAATATPAASVEGAAEPIVAALAERPVRPVPLSREQAWRNLIAARYEDGKRRSLQANKQVFRARALADIVRLVKHRHGGEGLPEGGRNSVMLAAASLLSWLVPPAQLPDAVLGLARELVSRDWYEAEWLGGGRGRSTIERAWAAAAGDTVIGPHGAVDPRLDYLRDGLLGLLEPTEAEMETLGLEALVTEAVRSSRRRAAARAERGPSVSETQPWVAEGISRATWHRRRKARAAAAAEAAEAVFTPHYAATQAALAEGLAAMGLAVRQNPTVDHVEVDTAGGGGSADLTPWGRMGVSRSAWYRGEAARKAEQQAAAERAAAAHEATQAELERRLAAGMSVGEASRDLEGILPW